MAAQFHFAKYALPLHLFLEGLEGLINIIVANENLHAEIPRFCAAYRAVDEADSERQTTSGAARHLTAKDADNRNGVLCLERFPIRWKII